MGRSFLISGGWGKRALEVARQMFVKAIEADPNFAHAYAALASCDCKRLLMEVESVSFQTIAASSERALALHPGLCEAYAAKGMAHYAAGESPRPTLRSSRRSRAGRIASRRTSSMAGIAWRSGGTNRQRSCWSARRS